MKRVLVAGLYHETNCFVETRTTLDQFQATLGPALLACAGDSSPLGGALEAGRELGWELVPALDLRANPSGPVDDAVFDFFWREFERHASPVLERGLDGVYLTLHGAMMCASNADVEGEFIRRLRALPGAGRLPVFGVFDLHAHLTAAMIQHSDGLVAYRENPHIDARQAARRAARLLDRAMAEGVRPRQYLAQPPLLWPPPGTGTASSPMRALEARAVELEARQPRFWAVNVNAGFAFGDMREAGVAFSVITTGPEDEARQALDELSALAWELRAFGLPEELDPDAAVAEAVRQTAGLTVLAEPSDNIGAGAPGDGTGLLRALLRQHARNAAVALADPSAVTGLQHAAIGQRIQLALGGRGSRLDPGPVTLEVELLSRGPGRFELEDKQSHLAAGTGDYFDMGACAVVRFDGLRILLTSRATPPMDLGQWRSQGIVPETLALIGVKAAVAHRRAFDPIAARQFSVSTPGPCTSQLHLLPYQHVRRPIFPLDHDAERRVTGQ